METVWRKVSIWCRTWGVRNRGFSPLPGARDSGAMCLRASLKQKHNVGGLSMLDRTQTLLVVRNTHKIQWLNYQGGITTEVAVLPRWHYYWSGRSPKCHQGDQHARCSCQYSQHMRNEYDTHGMWHCTILIVYVIVQYSQHMCNEYYTHSMCHCFNTHS